MPNLPPKMKILSILSKTDGKEKLKLPRSALFYKKARVCLKYFVNRCSFDCDIHLSRFKKL